LFQGQISSKSESPEREKMNVEKRILVVEDDPDGQALVTHILEYLNHPLDVVGDAEQASRYLFDDARVYQAVIIDLGLPGRDGWSLLAEIRGNEYTYGLHCIAVTAFHTSKVREETVKAGFNAYFSKPLDVMGFAKVLESLS
jgi:two-component system, sensor histidine kinase